MKADPIVIPWANAPVADTCRDHRWRRPIAVAWAWPMPDGQWVVRIGAPGSDAASHMRSKSTSVYGTGALDAQLATSSSGWPSCATLRTAYQARSPTTSGAKVDAHDVASRGGEPRRAPSATRDRNPVPGGRGTRRRGDDLCLGRCARPGRRRAPRRKLPTAYTGASGSGGVGVALCGWPRAKVGRDGGRAGRARSGERSCSGLARCLLARRRQPKTRAARTKQRS